MSKINRKKTVWEFVKSVRRMVKSL